MRNKAALISFIFILSIFIISTASAEIWFASQPKPVYSIGDNLEVSVSVSQTGEQLKAELFCENKSKIIFLKYLASETSMNIFQPLTKYFLKSMKGKCKIIALFGTAEAESSDFVISDSVSLKIETDNLNYNPGENIQIKGEAQKENSQLLNGFFELNFKDISVSGNVDNGKFTINFSVPENLASGAYLIRIKAYEKEGEEITNNGEKEININVKQIPKKIDIALSSQNVKPGNDLNFKIILYDQSENNINAEASYVIGGSEGGSIIKALIQTDKDENFSIEKNLSSGYYKIKAYSSGIYGEREIYVEENEEAEFSIFEGILTVRNIGNIKYNKAVQVKISDVVEIITPELDVGQEKKYKLGAPDGEYEVSVTDGKSAASDSNVVLTGDVVSVKEAGGSFFGRSSLAWIFLILVLGMFIFVSFRNTLKKKFVLSEPSSFASTRGGVVKVEKMDEKGIIQKELREAEHSIVIRGQKQDAALLCIKIKNQIGKTARENLEKILEKVYESKAVVYKSGDYIIAIFSPLVTKTFGNYIPAIKISLDIAKELQEYNKKFQDKIEFGIGVHSGDIVNRLQDGKLVFTGLGNSVALSKRIAEVSEAEVLLSKEIHQKTMADIQADKKEKEGLEVFTVSRVANRENNTKFIQDFLKRQGK